MSEFKAGDECYVLADGRRGSWSSVSAKRTVERVTKTLVVLDDGRRFSRERLTIRHGGTWDTWHEYLVAPDDTRIEQARATIAGANRKSRIRSLSGDIDDLCRFGKWDDALALVPELLAKLTEQIEP